MGLHLRRFVARCLRGVDFFLFWVGRSNTARLAHTPLGHRPTSPVLGFAAQQYPTCLIFVRGVSTTFWPPRRRNVDTLRSKTRRTRRQRPAAQVHLVFTVTAWAMHERCNTTLQRCISERCAENFEVFRSAAVLD